LRHRPRAFLALIAAPALLGAAAPGAEVSVTVTDLCAAKGQVLACLTSQARGFPDCSKDPSAHHLVVPVKGTAVDFSFGAIPPGTYAVSLVHDENANGKVDMMLFMPREGFGFSRDAKVRMGPPRFADAAFLVEGQAVHQRIRMRYML
jgi:uncharacterized protein (DUF2141 family)